MCMQLWTIYKLYSLGMSDMAVWVSLPLSEQATQQIRAGLLCDIARNTQLFSFSVHFVFNLSVVSSVAEKEINKLDKVQHCVVILDDLLLEFTA